MVYFVFTSSLGFCQSTAYLCCKMCIRDSKIAFSHLFSFYKSQVLYYCVHFVKRQLHT